MPKNFNAKRAYLFLFCISELILFESSLEIYLQEEPSAIKITFISIFFFVI